LEKEFQNHDQIVLVGGSGMFIDALCFGLDEIPADKSLREALTVELEEKGLTALLDELKTKDPEFYEQVDQKNPVRVLRAIEVIRLTGKTFTEMRKASKKEHSFEIVRFIIDHEREKLYQRINLRVDLMMENGLLEEVKSVYSKKHLNSLRTVGYSELFDFLDNKINLTEAVELIKQNSRRYAKRQLTWFRKHTEAHLIPFDTTDQMLLKVLNQLDNN
jgi:tRNA dimethylallyltransferase